MNFPPLFRIGLFLTERCNIKCSHCWFSCGPDKTAKVSKTQAEDYIKQALGLGAQWISFTGGEPFLEFELLVDLVSFSYKLGLKTEVVTNCFWANSKSAAQDKLLSLKVAGLDVLNLSMDDFHQEHIPINTTKHCYDAAIELKLKTVIMNVISSNCKLNAENIKQFFKDMSIQELGSEKINNPTALLIETPFYPIGRGVHIPEEQRLLKHIENGRACNDVLRDIGISPQGHVYPCCGPLSCLELMNLGNLKENSLRDILEGAWRNEIFQKISATGPFCFIDNASSRNYIDVCHLCFEVISKIKKGD
jgi:MoaA/NifB/PqqE/SkfB family radical SAM enzyme